MSGRRYHFMEIVGDPMLLPVLIANEGPRPWASVCDCTTLPADELPDSDIFRRSYDAARLSSSKDPNGPTSPS